jgi:ankyrin repeat protein
MSRKGAQKRKLFNAIYRGDGRRVRKLLKRGVSPNARDAHGSTALYIAAVQGEAWPVGELLAAGASPDVPSGGDSDGTPLCGAASWGHAPVLRALLAAGADPGLAEADGYTPLAWAVSGGSLDSVWMLLDAGADPNQADARGRTPLLRAAEHGQLSLVRLLLEHGADPSLADNDDLVPLEAARAKLGRDVEADLRGQAVANAPIGSTVETRRTVCVHVCHPDGGGSATLELECSHEEIVALLAERAG